MNIALFQPLFILRQTLNNFCGIVALFFFSSFLKWREPYKSRKLAVHLVSFFVTLILGLIRGVPALSNTYLYISLKHAGEDRKGAPGRQAVPRKRAQNYQANSGALRRKAQKDAGRLGVHAVADTLRPGRRADRTSRKAKRTASHAAFIDRQTGQKGLLLCR